MCQIAVGRAHCPSRRLPLVYPSLAPSAVMANCTTATNGWARADYAANAGSNVLLWWAGPSSWTQGLAGQGFDDVTASNGVSYERSKVKMADISDGTSNTYLVGEKYLNPNDYTTGADFGDDHGPFASDSDDWYRWTAAGPLQDTPGMSNVYIFGSAHFTGFNMAFCDGSVRVVSYSIDPLAHRYLGGRNDGKVIDAKKL